MAAIKKRSLVDQVYEMLRGDIITLRRPLGSNELQDELGVSCTPIREAVNRLQQEGLVVYENNVGAHILDLDQHDITEIEQLAMTLHCAAIRLAMAHGDRAAIVTGLEKYLEEYRRARNVQSEVMAVNRFVGTFYAHCGNRRLDANMISIQGQQLLLRISMPTALPSAAATWRTLKACWRRPGGGMPRRSASVCNGTPTGVFRF